MQTLRCGRRAATCTRLNAPVEAAQGHRLGSSLLLHQAEAINLASRAIHVVVATSRPHAGKTLAFNVPMLEATARDLARALYVYPTKALARTSSAR